MTCLKGLQKWNCPMSGDPLLDWLQPFDENLVDGEEQRVARVEAYEDIQDDDQEREGVAVQGERARPLPQPRLPVGRSFRNTN